MKKTYSKPTLVRQGILSQAATAVGSPVLRSDRRLKASISRVGTTVFGLPLYRFSYLGSDARFTGVMAQDVLGVMPRAVSRDATGFYSVDYGMLGIEMARAS
jgi:Chaperone of endosialidase